MIICICRRISDRHIAACVADGGCTAGAVFKQAGCAPQCGLCVPVIKALVGAASTAMNDDTGLVAETA